jgi:hypothetical protein
MIRSTVPMATSSQEKEIPEMVMRVALALMRVTARPPADKHQLEVPVLTADPDFDDLPIDHTQGTCEDNITQAAVLKLALAAIEEMLTPTEVMYQAGGYCEPFDFRLADGWRTWRPGRVIAATIWRDMVTAALNKPRITT